MLHAKSSVMNELWFCIHYQECANRCLKGIISVSNMANLRAMAIKRLKRRSLGPDMPNFIKI